MRSLLMNVTRPPAAIVTSCGVIPAAVIVTVAFGGGAAGAGIGAATGGGAGLGAATGAGWGEGEAPSDPQAAVSAAHIVTATESTFRAR